MTAEQRWMVWTQASTQIAVLTAVVEVIEEMEAIVDRPPWNRSVVRIIGEVMFSRHRRTEFLLISQLADLISDMHKWLADSGKHIRMAHAIVDAPSDDGPVYSAAFVDWLYQSHQKMEQFVVQSRAILATHDQLLLADSNMPQYMPSRDEIVGIGNTVEYIKNTVPTIKNSARRAKNKR